VEKMYVRLAGRVRVNTSSLNAQGTVGNVIELARAHILLKLDGGFELVEVPVITGNTFKHWHFVHFVTAYKELGGEKLCEYCKRLVGYRSPDTKGRDERYFVERCAGEDLHGFLQPERGVRRESLVKASFLIPAEDCETRFDIITHNRVVVSEQGTVPRGQQGMMLFKRQYSSSLYGFSLALDLYYVGRLLYAGSDELVVGEEEAKRRGKASLLALLPLLAGEVGASRSRAQPVWRVEELIAAWSPKPLPSLVHGHYADYVEQSVRTIASFSKLTGAEAEIVVYGIDEGAFSRLEETLRSVGVDSRVKLVRRDSWQGVVEYLVDKYESSGSAR